MFATLRYFVFEMNKILGKDTKHNKPRRYNLNLFISTSVSFKHICFCKSLLALFLFKLKHY